MVSEVFPGVFPGGFPGGWDLKRGVGSISGRVGPEEGCRTYFREGGAWRGVSEVFPGPEEGHRELFRVA